MSRRVMFYVQHLLGIGHLKRASLIARAMAAAGLDVSVVLGGREVPGVRLRGLRPHPLALGSRRRRDVRGSCSTRGASRSTTNGATIARRGWSSSSRRCVRRC